jgi:zinc protease
MNSTPIRKIAAAATFLGMLAGGSTRAADRQPQIPDLKVEKYTLPNGLDVILHEDHTTPVVGVNLWYKVGSKDESPGRTGFAHLFEHLMFQGSQHHDKEYFGPVEKLGAQINGSTNTDRTNYFETLPSNGLERALWLEADRMGFLLPALTQAKLDNQRDVVKNERRQRVDNVPYGQSMEKLLEALYPPDHPYHHSVIGSLADLSAASLKDVSAFFRNHYGPNNASLCIAGDFQPDEAKRLVEKYFGSLPAGPKVEKLAPRVPALSAPKHVVMTDRVTLARTQLVWPTVERGHADEAALEVLSAVLGQINKENRLYRTLVYERQLAVSAMAMHRAEALAGTLGIMVTARPRQGLDELVRLAEAEVERIKRDGPTDAEVAKAQNARESRQIVSLQATTRKADFLNGNNVQDGDPLSYKDEMKRVFAVTPADVKRVAEKYLTANRVRLDVNPGAPTPRAPEVDVDRKGQEVASSSSPEIKDSFDRSIMPEPGPAPQFTPPPVARRKLSNGLEVLVAERHNLPILTLNVVAKGGQDLVPASKEGLAALTADLVTEGTERRDSLTLAGELSEIGANLNAGAEVESFDLSLTTLTKHTDKALELFGDVLLHPAFPPQELERLRKQKLAALMRRADSPTAVAGVVFPKILYGDEHPYGRIDTAKSVRGLSRDDVAGFFRRVMVPNNAALIVVGDTTPDAITAQLESALKDWKPGEAPEAKRPEPPAAKGVTIYLVDKPGAAQSVLAVGQVGVARKTPDYFPLVVMNGVLGGQFSSRINLNLREDKGYTYGARSSFAFRQGPGPFEAGGSVKTDVTKEALVELMKELEDINGRRPVTDDELAFSKDRLVKGFPSRFETTSAVAGALTDLVLFDLPADYFTSYQSKIDGVTKDDVSRVAKKYIDPEHLTILIVGDRTKVEPTLKSLPYAGVVNALDPEGNPAVSGTPEPGK